MFVGENNSIPITRTPPLPPLFPAFPTHTMTEYFFRLRGACGTAH